MIIPITYTAEHIVIGAVICLILYVALYPVVEWIVDKWEVSNERD